MVIDSNKWNPNPDLVMVMIVNYTRTLQNGLIAAQRSIFDDLAWQHQAFVEAGLPELGAATGAPVDAWRDIFSGDPARVRNGNKALLRRGEEGGLGPVFQNGPGN